MTKNSYGSSIKKWNENDRPRERLLKLGPSALSNFELLAILIRTGSGNHKSAIDLAKEILNNFDNDLNKLAELDYNQLRSIKGIGSAKAASIIAAFELCRRRLQENKLQKQEFLNSHQVFDYIIHRLRDYTIEKVILLTVNNKNTLIKEHEISCGGQSFSVIDIREIIRKALYDKATGIILIHNHPSDNITPSHNDIEITKKLKEACNFVDIRFLDHLIIGKNTDKYFSFADENLL
ncbi:MAG: DNA repair protein RadC [Bacteroidales bacterium]|nr:DNA repair protein RadC [Bacteroidales bacterium]